MESETSPVTSTSNATTFTPFWKNELKDIYAKFPLPTLPDSPVLPTKSSDSSPNDELVVSLIGKLMPKETKKKGKTKMGNKRKATSEGKPKANKMTKLSPEKIAKLKEKEIAQKLKVLNADLPEDTG